MTIQESFQAVRSKYPRFSKQSYDYVQCPAGGPAGSCGGFLIRYAYDSAWCPSCGYREAYLD